MNKNTNIVKYPKALNFNLGLAIFVVIFVYLIINIYNYYTAKHITYYEVDEGSIQMKTSYNALALREEKIIYSGNDGFVNYYLKDNTRAKDKSFIASVDETGSVSEQIANVTDKVGIVTTDSANEIARDIYKYINGFDPLEFYDVYRFKEDVDSSLMEAVNLSILNSISDYAMAASKSGTFNIEEAKEPGIVAYYTDGYENVTVDNFTSGMLDKSSYTKDSLKGRTRINTGDPLYKIITSEDWQLVFEVDDTIAELLKEEDVVKVRFREDDTTAWSYVSTKEIDDHIYMILSLNNSMVRFASERFIDIEIVTDKNEGLKIPNSSITKKNFFTIPEEYFVDGGDMSSKGVILARDLDAGIEESTYLNCDIYYSKDDNYYISENEIKKGTKILHPTTGETYTVAANSSLEGVYNVNKGFAVFKIVRITYSNDEYSIIETGTRYGLSMYDHIALDASIVDEGEIINL